MVRAKSRRQGKARLGIKAKIDLPTIKLNVKSQDALRSLREIRKIMESVQRHPEPGLYDLREIELENGVYYDARFTQLSGEFSRNRAMMQVASALSDTFHDSRVRRTNINTLSEINVSKGTAERRIDAKAAKKAASHILGDVDKSRISNILVHVMGDIPKRDAAMVVDHLRNELPGAKMESAFKSRRLTDKVTVEAIMFGEFGAELSDERWDGAGY